MTIFYFQLGMAKRTIRHVLT